jgi:glycosyltransferase involved in cell wall biosynthesis
MKLSIVIPAFNEERFIGTLLERIAAVDLGRLGMTAETIVVDDGSTDGTAGIAAAFSDVVLVHQGNAGKGAAVRAGLARATGDYVLVQDADLEYDPNDYLPMLEALLAGRGDIVYGSRYLRGAKANGQSWTTYLGGRSLSLVAWAFTGTYLTDTVTAYKLFARADLMVVPLETNGFELDHEITAKMLARQKRIVEVPITYRPRSRADGKKIRLRDWFIAVRTFWRYGRFGGRATS